MSCWWRCDSVDVGAWDDHSSFVDDWFECTKRVSRFWHINVEVWDEQRGRQRRDAIESLQLSELTNLGHRGRPLIVLREPNFSYVKAQSSTGCLEVCVNPSWIHGAAVPLCSSAVRFLSDSGGWWVSVRNAARWGGSCVSTHLVPHPSDCQWCLLQFFASSAIDPYCYCLGSEVLCSFQNFVWVPLATRTGSLREGKKVQVFSPHSCNKLLPITEKLKVMRYKIAKTWIRSYISESHIIDICLWFKYTKNRWDGWVGTRVQYRQDGIMRYRPYLDQMSRLDTYPSSSIVIW